MTQNPKTILINDLAAKALHIQEKHSITSLPVCDELNSPVGLVHIHDLLKAGVA
jgi:arabinose-5-phosphate isomerase